MKGINIVSIEQTKKILDDLNPQQKAAVIHVENPVRIIAGPGSGKTKVLTRKIAYLIKNIKLKSYRIMALTFTNKAANEMKSRVEELIGSEQSNNMMVTTFHSFCYRFLKEEIENLEHFKKDFLIVDGVDQDNVLKEIYKNFQISSSNFSYFGMKEYISQNKNNYISPDIALSEAEETRDEVAIIKAKVYHEYQKLLLQSKSLDYDDLLIYTKDILVNFPQVKNKWTKRFDYFLIDEFQDTSRIQFEIIELLADKKNITIVGDPDQTIYSWRGADISFINNFDKLYPDVVTITLNQNYRSTSNILKIANNLIKNNSNRLPKDLFTENEEGRIVEYYNGMSQDNESTWVISQINKLKSDKTQLKHIAILYRSNYYSRSIEDALIKQMIPYKIINGQKFYEREEIKDVLAYLRCIYEPTDISLKRIINVPSRKLGAETIKKLIQFADSQNEDLWNSWINHFNLINIPFEKKQNLFKLIETIRKYQSLVRKKEPINSIIEAFLDEIGYIKMLEDNKDNTSMNRLENIKELIKSIKNWETENPDQYLQDYLDFISLEKIDNGDKLNQNYVSLMTIHAAKGLEFKNVFVIGLNEGVFPSSKVLKKDDEEGESFGLEEERRLAYVAFTRAEKRLFLSSSKDSYSDYKNNQSRFVTEINIEDSVFIEPNAKSALEERVHINNQDYEPGDKIYHINFGEGIVLDINGDSIIIEFKDKKVGVKQLLKNHKSIEKIY